MAISDKWLKHISVYQKNTKWYEAALALVEYCSQTNQIEFLDTYIYQRIVFNSFNFIETLEQLHNEFTIGQHSIGLFKRKDHHLKSILAALINLKKEGINSNEVTELMVTLYESCSYDQVSIFQNFDKKLIDLLKKMHHAKEFSPAVVTLLIASSPALEPASHALTLLKEAGLYQEEYIEILTYRDSIYPIDYAQALIILNEGQSLNSETLKYFKRSILPYNFLNALINLKKENAITPENARLVLTTELGCREQESKLSMFVLLRQKKINFALEDLTPKMLKPLIFINEINCLDQNVFNTLKDNIKNLGISVMNSFEYIAYKKVSRPDLILRLCKNELPYVELHNILKAEKEAYKQKELAQKALKTEGFIHHMNKSAKHHNSPLDKGELVKSASDSNYPKMG